MDDPSFRLTMNHLRLVVAIDEEHSLVGAAKCLHMTQPAVTKSLQVAERLLGVRLFDRTSSGMVATVYGEALIAQAKIVLSQLGRAAQNIGDLRDGRVGRVVVGTLSAPAAGLIPTSIVRLRRERPNLFVNVVEGTNAALVPALRRGDVELIVGRLPEALDPATFTQETLFNDFVVVVAGPEHELVSAPPTDLADLVGYEWILPPEDTSLRRQINKAFWDQQLDPPPAVVESRSWSLTQSLLSQTRYLAAWPWQVIYWELAAKRIGLVPTSLSIAARAVGVTTRREMPLSPAARMFVDALSSFGAELQVRSKTVPLPMVMSR